MTPTSLLSVAQCQSTFNEVPRFVHFLDCQVCSSTQRDSITRYISQPFHLAVGCDSYIARNMCCKLYRCQLSLSQNQVVELLCAKACLYIRNCSQVSFCILGWAEKVNCLQLPLKLLHLLVLAFSFLEGGKIPHCS